MSRIKKVGVIGYGYWGKKLAAKFKELNALTSICDENDLCAEQALNEYMVTPWPSYKEMLAHSPIDAVAIATPPETHYEIAKYCLQERFHVLCEKPLALSLEHAKELEDLAIENKRRLQVDYIYLACPGIQAMPIPPGAADMHIRLWNIGGAPSDSTRKLVWAGLPHALSLAVRFFDDSPTSIDCFKTEENRIAFCLHYKSLDSRCFIDIADYAGQRRRSVLIHDHRHPGATWEFSADKPSCLMHLSYASFNGFFHQRKEVPGHIIDEIEPLMEVCKSFLSGGVIEDRIGSKVARLTDQLLNSNGMRCLK